MLRFHKNFGYNGMNKIKNVNLFLEYFKSIVQYYYRKIKIHIYILL